MGLRLFLARIFCSALQIPLFWRSFECASYLHPQRKSSGFTDCTWGRMSSPAGPLRGREGRSRRWSRHTAMSMHRPLREKVSVSLQKGSSRGVESPCRQSPSAPGLGAGAFRGRGRSRHWQGESLHHPPSCKPPVLKVSSLFLFRFIKKKLFSVSTPELLRSFNSPTIQMSDFHDFLCVCWHVSLYFDSF